MMQAMVDRETEQGLADKFRVSNAPLQAVCKQPSPVTTRSHVRTRMHAECRVAPFRATGLLHQC